MLSKLRRISKSDRKPPPTRRFIINFILKSRKKRQMLQHRLLQPEYDPNFMIVGFTNILFFDVNHVIDPGIHHNDLYNLVIEITRILAPNPNQAIENLQVHQTATYRVGEMTLPMVRQILQDGHYTVGAPRRIRSVVAMIVEINIVPHGNFNITDVKLYLHCDNQPR